MRMRQFLLAVVVGIVLFFAVDIGRYFFYPDVGRLKRVNPGKTAFMQYREQEWQRQGKKKRIERRWVRLSAMSPYIVKAVIIAEDDKFWAHEGFDFDAMQKAFEKDLRKMRFSAGGSTISQQLAKNLYLSPSRSPLRKIKEAILTWRIERRVPKRRIIELYLNVAEWGDGLFGVEVAARHYYGKAASALTAEEAARLAVVLPNPRRYHATGSGKYVERRSQIIYGIMVKRGIVIPEYEDLMNAPEEKNTVDSNAGEPADDR